MKKVWISFTGRGYGLKRVVLGGSSSTPIRKMGTVEQPDKDCGKRQLWFKLGYNRWKGWKVPEQVSVLLFRKKTFLLLGTNQRLGDATNKLVRLRFPDIYHRKGIHRSGQILRRKTGKKAWKGY